MSLQSLLLWLVFLLVWICSGITSYVLFHPDGTLQYLGWLMLWVITTCVMDGLIICFLVIWEAFKRIRND